MPLERLDDETRTYRGITYEIKVYYSPDNAYTGDERLVVVEPRTFEPCVESVYASTPLDPTSILPWRDPEPISKDEHVEQAAQRFERRIDSHKDRGEKARQ